MRKHPYVLLMLVAGILYAGCDSFSLDAPSSSDSISAGEALDPALELHTSTSEISPGQSIFVEGGISAHVRFDRVLVQLLRDDGRQEHLIREIESAITRRGSRFVFERSLDIPDGLLPSLESHRQYYVGFIAVREDGVRHGSFEQVILR